MLAAAILIAISAAIRVVAVFRYPEPEKVAVSSLAFDDKGSGKGASTDNKDLNNVPKMASGGAYSNGDLIGV